VFFFQAEDGIRDWSVTGVQTCALPISPDGPGPPARKGSSKAATGGPGPSKTPFAPGIAFHCVRVSSRFTKKSLLSVPRRCVKTRSEERRVGKEGRASGWRCSLNKGGER